MNEIKEVKILRREDNGDILDVIKVNLDFTNRTNLHSINFYEDGKWYNVDCWEHKDGKRDTYCDALREALTNGLNPYLEEDYMYNECKIWN